MKNNPFYKILRFIFLIVGILLLISVIAPLLKPTTFQFFSVVALFFPVFWFTVIVFLILFLIAKSRLAIISMLLLLTGFYQLMLIFNFPDGLESNTKINKIKLITFNTGNNERINPLENRKQSFSNELFQTSDIICLQEFTPTDDFGIDVLQKFNNNVNVDYYGVAGGDSSGLSIYTNSEIVDFGWLKQELEDTYALWCNVDIQGDTITVINVQLQSIRLNDEELESMTNFKQIINLPGNLSSIYSKLVRGFLWREEQVENLINLIKNSQYPVILCGDYNDPPSSYSYSEISNLLIDTFMEKGSGFGTTYAGKLPFLRIDYIMVDEGFNVLDYQKVYDTHTDHYAISAEVAF